MFVISKITFNEMPVALNYSFDYSVIGRIFPELSTVQLINLFVTIV